MREMKMDKRAFVVVDYEMGNLKSVSNALKFLGCDAVISSRKDDIEKACAIILPGVGAFGEAMNNLRRLNLVEILNAQVMKSKKPFLGICLGMQLIAEDSEENGYHKGLGWITGHVRKIKIEEGLRLPHIGWNNIKILKEEPLFKRIKGDLNFYFVHTYHVECNESRISAKCDYSGEVTAAIQQDNIFAVQFHPEKSQENGLRLLRNFVNFVEAYTAKEGYICSRKD